MGEALLKIADEIRCKLDNKTIKKFESFWITEINEIINTTGSGTTELETNFQVKTPNLLLNILQVLANIKTDLKYSAEKRTEYRKSVSHRSSEWLFMLRQISDEITSKLAGKQPIIIFEDLDKINPQDAWNIFSSNAVTLTGFSFPVIYTFPIALSYDPRFTALEGYFITKTLPVIKQETIAGEPYEEGINVIKEIIAKRANIDLFEEDVLNILIKKTGGSLRDLFYAINTSAQRAIRRSSEVIAKEDIQKALEELKTSLTRRIERKHYAFLVDIHKGNHQLIEDKEMLLAMLQANAVLEYNGTRWHNVHPLVADFLTDQRLV